MFDNRVALILKVIIYPNKLLDEIMFKDNTNELDHSSQGLNGAELRNG